MNNVNHELRRATESDLKRVIEPLASYICATHQPEAVLILALTVLFNEVDQINRAANAHLATFSQNVPILRPAEKRQQILRKKFLNLPISPPLVRHVNRA